MARNQSVIINGTNNKQAQTFFITLCSHSTWEICQIILWQIGKTELC